MSYKMFITHYVLLVLPVVSFPASVCCEENSEADRYQKYDGK